MLTMIVPMYMSEVSTAGIRGTLVVLQQCKSQTLNPTDSISGIFLLNKILLIQ